MSHKSPKMSHNSPKMYHKSSKTYYKSPKMPRRGSSHRKSFSRRKIGPLQRQLRQGEYGMFRFSPMFESNFVQISKQGGPIEIHNQEQIVTVGITSTSPVFLIPNVMLLARPVVPSEDEIPLYKAMFHLSRPVKFELTRLFPLRFVKISVHNAERQQLRFKLASGRTFYLQLCAEADRRGHIFEAWIRIIHLLRPASEANADEQKRPRALKSRGSPSQLVKAQIPPPRKNSPQRSPAKSISWNIHTATKTMSALENKTKKKNPSPPKPPKKVVKCQTPPPALPFSQPPPLSSTEAVAGDSFISNPSSELLETLQKSPSDKRPIDKRSSDKSPINKRSSDKSPINKRSSDKSPINKRSSDKSPINKRSSDKSPINKRSSDKSPINKRSSDKSPINKRSSDKGPINKRSSDKSPIDKSPSDESPIDKGPSDESQAVKKPEHKSSPQSARKSKKKSHSSRSRSRQRGVSRKPSKFATLLRACTWGRKKKKRSAKAQGKGKKH